MPADPRVSDCRVVRSTGIQSKRLGLRSAAGGLTHAIRVCRLLFDLGQLQVPAEEPW
jgi:hypothetical protein